MSEAQTKIEEAMAHYWGERCAEHEPGCPRCDAWAEFDKNTRPEPINSAALGELAQIDRDLIDDHASTSSGVNDRLFPAEAWQELVEYDDRLSPAEYPDMALITFDELASFMARAHPNECTCMEVVGENPDCIVHGSLAGEVSALEADIAAEREKVAGLVRAAAAYRRVVNHGFGSFHAARVHESAADALDAELAKHKEGE